MNNVITVSYDNNEPDLPCVVCCENGDKIIMKVAYTGEIAEQLHRIVTEQGYLQSLLDKIKN